MPSPSTPSTEPPQQWDYSAMHGQHNWYDHCKVTGKRQSPIDIQHDQTIFDEDLSLETNPLILGATQEEGDCGSCSFEVLNKRVNVSFTPIFSKNNGGETSKPMQISGGPLDGVYDFKECHFHWSREGNQVGGSEHLLNGNHSHAELHLVHSKRDVENPLAAGDGLCVLGIRLVSRKDVSTDPILKHLLKLIPKVPYVGDNSGSAEEVPLYKLLNTIREKYYTYEGSLTTPPLAECVKWIVFSDEVLVSEEDFKLFRSVYAVTKDEKEQCDGEYYDPFKRSGAESGCSCADKPIIGDNYRDFCDLSGRQVRRSFK